MKKEYSYQDRVLELHLEGNEFVLYYMDETLELDINEKYIKGWVIENFDLAIKETIELFDKELSKYKIAHNITKENNLFEGD